MLRNVKEAWVRTMVQQRDDTVLIDAAILGPPQVFEASMTRVGRSHTTSESLRKFQH